MRLFGTNKILPEFGKIVVGSKISWLPFCLLQEFTEDLVVNITSSEAERSYALVVKSKAAKVSNGDYFQFWNWLVNIMILLSTTRVFDQGRFLLILHLKINK